MNAEDLNRLHAEYRQHVEAARDAEASLEARTNAQALMIEARHALDQALIDLESEREDDKRSAAVEAAQRTAAVLPVRQSAIPLDKIRAFGQSNQRNETISFTVPMAADWTTTDTTTYSSYTVPQTWAGEVYNFQLAESGVLKAGPKILNTSNGNQINYPKLLTDMVSNAGAEGVAATETNAVFSTVALNSYRVDGYTPISQELFRDSGVDIEAELRTLAARSLAKKAAPYYGDIDIGTGSSLPAAITVGITSAVTAASQTTVTMDELKTLFYGVLPQYRANASWVANSTLTLAVALMKDSDGNYMWNPSVMSSEPDRFLGKPWYEDAYFDASASGNIPVIFGDVYQAYMVRRIGGMEISLSRDYAFPSFEITARWAMWHDAVALDSIACKGVTLA